MNRETFNEEKSSTPMQKQRMSTMQKSFIKSSLHIRDKSKSSNKVSASATAVDTILAVKMADEVPVLNEEEYEELIKDIEYPKT